ncbi:nucleoside hydrolase-like domain-containing protein [Flavobacterium sp. ARAG 55.4]|uniref:nucleoside hydrolase-like domain-containing protein n=1 Tax=Flavobacterium sp. ARAG 55.4 TaxID=3451357 RepID=UPI003F45AB7F
MSKKIYFLTTLLSTFIVLAQKPKVWIYSDMSDKTIKGKDHGTANDPDDISGMAGYLLMANMFDTKGIVIASTHRSEHKTSGNQAEWANTFFGEAYKKDVVHLNKNIGGYPESINFIQSCIKETAEKYNSAKTYNSLKEYKTVEMLFKELDKSNDIINVLCWGSLTEPAILVNYCITKKREDILNKIRFIAHWTNSSLHQGTIEKPWKVANCNEDRSACEYIKTMALNGRVKYYECGAIGQHGIVTGSPKGIDYFDQFKKSNLGKIFAEGKFVFNSVDHSDAATYWVLLGDWGVNLNDITSNGTNLMEVEQKNEDQFKLFSKSIHNELLRRSDAAVSK